MPLNIPSLFTSSEPIEKPDTEQLIRVPLDRIEPFPDHPFRVRDDDRMQELVESITRNGVLHPALLLPIEDKEGSYYYVAGHRRGLASEKAGLSDIPAIIKDITLDEAIIMMVDSNLQQRENLLPMEKAWAYRMKIEAMARQGQRNDLTSRQVVGKLEMADLIGETTGESGRQVQRYIRLTYLIPEFQDLVDTNKIAFIPASDISFLTEKEQSQLLDIMERDLVSPSVKQAAALKRASKDGALDFELMYAIMKEEKPNQRGFHLSPATHDRVRAYFPKDATPKDIEDGIIDALELRKRQLSRKTQLSR